MQIKENGRSHETSMYELMADEKALVVRRGSPFNMVVTFSHKNYRPKQDNMKLEFHTGMRKNYNNFNNNSISR